MQAEKFLIGNDFVASQDIIEIKNPFTNETVKKVFRSTGDHIKKSLAYFSPIYLHARAIL